MLATAACSSGNADDAAPSSAPALSGAYLALGDSVPFGYRGGEDADTYRDPTSFIGYPQLVGSALGLDVVNATCPGETTASFSDASAQSNGCENSPTSANGYRTAYPLHVAYDSPGQSQLDFALDYLERAPDVSLVTLQIGANDAFICQATTADRCASEVPALADSVQKNVDGILEALRGQGGYTGKIVVVTYYALDYSTTDGLATQLLDTGIANAAQANGAVVASGYDAFQPTAAKSGGDSIAAGLVRRNDVHPTPQGQQLLADAVTAAVKG